MAGSLLFVHGTGVRDITRTLNLLDEGLGRIEELATVRVVAAEWGLQVGPDALDPTPALPVESSKGIAGPEHEPEQLERDVAEWELLLADPLFELRIMSHRPRSDSDGAQLFIGTDSPDVDLEQRLSRIEVSDGILDRAGITKGELDETARDLGRTEALGQAAAAVGDSDDVELLKATARSVVASMIDQHVRGVAEDLPQVCTDAAARDALVGGVHDCLRGMGAPKGFVSRAVMPTLAPLATRVAVRRRIEFTAGATDFVRDIAYYVKRGEEIREYLQHELRDLPRDEPVVLVGHSLGGVAAVDLLSSHDPDIDGRIDLLVTIGSQAPLLYLMDALYVLRPGKDMAPFTPWLNVYDRNDLLSFCAERVWPDTNGIVDAQVRTRVPFPMSHSAYWSQDELYRLLAEHWPKM